MPNLNDIKQRGIERDFKIEGVDEEARTVRVAFSSEAVVRDWFGYNILDHGAGAVDLSRFEAGAPVLVDHDTRDQVGVVESAEIGDDRRGRAVIRFGRSQRAEEIWRDVVDGIRRNISVGAHVIEIEAAGDHMGESLYRTTKWQPYELTITSVPADYSIGVNRSKSTTERTMPDEVKTPKNPPADPAVEQQKPVDVDGIRRSAAEGERRRVADLLEVGEQYQAMDLARSMVSEGRTVDDLNRAILERMGNGGGNPTGDSHRTIEDMGLTSRERGEFSLVRALRALSDPKNRNLQEQAAFEIDVSRSWAEKVGAEPKGIMVPPEVLTRAMSTDTTGAAGTNPATTGNLIETVLQTGSFIELLRVSSIMMGLGTRLSGLVGNLEIPKQTGGAAAGWIGEDGDAPETDIEIGLVPMAPKTVAAYSEMTRRLLMQSSMDVEAMVRRDLAIAMANAIDLAALYGTGASNQPVGIINQSGIQEQDFAATNPTFAEIVSMETLLATANADMGTIAYLLNPVQRGHFKVTARGNGVDAPIWEQGNTLNGYATRVGNRVTAGDVWFGNWADLLMGMWGGLDLTVDPYTHSLKGRLRIVVFQDVDIAVRHPESFVRGNALIVP